MSDKDFTPLHKLLKSGISPAEIVDRIDHGDLHWRDDFGRHVPAGNSEKESVIGALRVHLKMLNDPNEYEGNIVTEYLNQWSIVDTPFMVRHPLVRGGFLAVSATDDVLAKPLPKTPGGHISKKLATLNQAADRFWENADPDERGTHSNNSEVVVWLIQQGFSESLAEKGATIIRPEWAPTGRKPEE